MRKMGRLQGECEYNEGADLYCGAGEFARGWLCAGLEECGTQPEVKLEPAGGAVLSGGFIIFADAEKS